MAEYYDRYRLLRENGQVKNVPFIPIPGKLSDKKEVWRLGFSRMDKLSQKYYGTSTHGFLILLANPQWSLDGDIPDGTIIRIPFPFKQTIEQYHQVLNNYLKL